MRLFFGPLSPEKTALVAFYFDRQSSPPFWGRGSKSRQGRLVWNSEPPRRVSALSLDCVDTNAPWKGACTQAGLCRDQCPEGRVLLRLAKNSCRQLAEKILAEISHRG